MMSPSRSLCWLASAGCIQAELSQVILVSGLGSSCSQPSFAKRPSQTFGSGRKMISRPGAGAADAGGSAPEGVAAGWLGAAGAVAAAAGAAAAGAGVAAAAVVVA